MDQRRASTSTPFVVVLQLVAATVGLLLVPGLFFADRSTAGTFALEGVVIGVAATTAGIALVRGASRGTAHGMLVGAGLLALAAQSLLVGLGANLWERPLLSAYAFTSHAWQAGWLVAALCFVLAIAPPAWAERLGGWTVAGSLAVLTIADLVLIAARLQMTKLSDAQLVDGSPAPFEQTSGLHWVLGLAVGAALLWAAWGEARASAMRHDPHACLSAAWIAAAGAQIVFVASPSAYRPIFHGGNVLQLTAVALAFSGYLLATRTDPLDGGRTSSGGDEARAEIAAVASHELRGPITSIRGLAATATQVYDSLTDEERREFFQLIDDESRRLSEVADQTSMAMKLDAGSLRYEFRVASITDVVVRAAEGTPHGDHPLDIDVDAGLQGSIDAVRLGEVVHELVRNAAKYSPADAPIGVRAYAHGSNVVIEVGDEGPGIPAERREMAFERFGRIRPSGYEEVAGAGLGLFVAKTHVHGHGGRIEVNDGVGGGTMLRITIPRERRIT